MRIIPMDKNIPLVIRLLAILTLMFRLPATLLAIFYLIGFDFLRVDMAKICAIYLVSTIWYYYYGPVCANCGRKVHDKELAFKKSFKCTDCGSETLNREKTMLKK